MQIPAGFSVEAVELVNAAQRFAVSFGHVVVDPEHVVHAIVSSDNQETKALATDLEAWCRSDILNRFRILPTKEGVIDPDASARLNEALRCAVEMGGRIHHLANAMIESYKKADASRFDHWEASRSAEELERERAYEESERARIALEHAKNVTAKNVRLAYSFDSETGSHVVDLKVEAGPGFSESVDGPQAIRKEAAVAVVDIVARLLGLQKARSNELEADGDFEHVGGSLEGNIFD